MLEGVSDVPIEDIGADTGDNIWGRGLEGAWRESNSGSDSWMTPPETDEPVEVVSTLIFRGG